MRVAIVGAALLGCVGVPPPAPGPDSGDPCVDSDGDGYLAEGCPEVTAAEADCIEGDATHHPGALEVCGDGLDQDCAGGDLDCAGELTGNQTTFEATSVGVANSLLAARWTADEGFALAELGTAEAPTTNLLYAGPMGERLSAVHMFGDFFSWETATTPVVDELIDGPALTRFRVTWAANDGSTTGMTGETIVTVHPDGRIHRDEDLEVLVSAIGNHLTAYVSLEPDLFTHADWTVDSSGPYDVSTFDPLVSQFDFFFNDDSGTLVGASCAYHDSADRAVGFGWKVPPSPVPRGPRASQSQSGGLEENHQLALQFDWHRAEDYPAATYRGEISVVVGPVTTPPCAGLESAIAATQLPLAMSTAAGASITTGGTGDDDGDGYNEGGGYWQVAVDDGASAATLSFSTLGATRAPAPAATLRISGTAGVDPIVELDGSRLVHGGDYLLHHADGELVLFINRQLGDSTLSVSHIR